MQDDDFRELIERADQVRQVMQHPGWVIYEDWLRHKAQPHQKRVLDGNFSDMADYRESVGFGKGIVAALSALVELEMLVENERARRVDDSA